MRKKFDDQIRFSHLIPHNKVGKELENISNVLDDCSFTLNKVYQDVTTYAKKAKGRKGLNADQILRCAVLKQYRCYTYEELEFHLEDSTTCRAFTKMNPGQYPKKSTLQENIKAISANTWEYINAAIVHKCLQDKIEDVDMTRTDATAVDTDIHEPTDSTLLQDGIRVITKVLNKIKILDTNCELEFSDHNRAAKKKVLTIRNCKEKKRKHAYKDLLKLGANVVDYAQQALGMLESYTGKNPEDHVSANMLADQLNYYLHIMNKVIDQTKRRVLYGEVVPADEKVVSFFECHSDIIKKKNRETQFGHKVYVTTGKSGIILDCYLPKGNPGDTSVFPEILKRQEQVLNRNPRQMAADGGFASKENLKTAQKHGIKDMVFAKKRGLKLKDMAKSKWVYNKLRNFRAGIEGIISILKRAFGLSRCTWKDWEGFKQYVWSNIVSFNLQKIARA